MSEQDYQWDLFISYSRALQEWVVVNLVGALKGCRTVDGRPLRIFIDTENIRLGVNWIEPLYDCIQKSAVVILVLSPEYYSSDVCHFEMAKAIQRDPGGLRNATIPLLARGEMSQVPGAFNHINVLNAQETGWFDKLAKSLNLRVHGKVSALRFVSVLSEATAGETLPEIRVVTESDGERVREDQDVTLFSEKSVLQGTTSVRSENGLAVFKDLFLQTPAETTRLVATADGCSAVFSEHFPVKAPRAIASPPREALLPRGEPAFLADSDTVVIFGDSDVRLFDLTGASRTQAVPISWPVRFRRRMHGGVLLCGWRAEVLWIGADGTRREWSILAPNGYAIAGDAAESEADVLLGLWSGQVYRLTPNGEVKLELQHEGGVQSLAARNGEIFLCDLDGALMIYRGGRYVARERIEPAVRAAKLFAQSLVVVGERSMYDYSLVTRRMSAVPLPVALATALGGGERIVAVAGDGKGLLVDERLRLSVFHAWPGSTPVSVDKRGTLCVLRNPDGSSSLLHDGRMILHHPAGAVSVSAGGDWVALEEQRGNRIVDAGSLIPAAAGAPGE